MNFQDPAFQNHQTLFGQIQPLAQMPKNDPPADPSYIDTNAIMSPTSMGNPIMQTYDQARAYYSHQGAKLSENKFKRGRTPEKSPVRLQ